MADHAARVIGVISDFVQGVATFCQAAQNSWNRTRVRTAFYQPGPGRETWTRIFHAVQF